MYVLIIINVLVVRSLHLARTPDKYVRSVLSLGGNQTLKKSITAAAVLSLAFASMASSSARAEGLSSLFGGTLNPFHNQGLSIPTNQDAFSQLQLHPAFKNLVGSGEIHSLALKQKITGGLLTTLKYQHFYKKVPVIGSVVAQHFGPKGLEISSDVAQFDLDVNPAFDADAAVAVARSRALQLPVSGQPQLKILPGHNPGDAQLIYWVTLNATPVAPGRDILINANTGKVIGDLSHEMRIAPIEIRSAQGQGVEILPLVTTNPLTGQQSLKGCQLMDYDTQVKKQISAAQCQAYFSGADTSLDQKCQITAANKADGTSDDPLVIFAAGCKVVAQDSVITPGLADTTPVKVLDDMTKILTYFQDHFHRDSYDNHGAKVVNVIHVGTGFGNAFWDIKNSIMAFGDGDGTMAPMTSALDVIAHEFTHGVTAATANLIGMGESGALNEATSDFFGELVEGKGTWTMGEDLFPAGSGKVIRNLKDPTLVIDEVLSPTTGQILHLPDPAKFSDYVGVAANDECSGNNDGCWVHFNSTIWSHGLYLIFEAIGHDKAEALYYSVQTQYLTENSGFKDAAKAVMKACGQLYQADDCTKVQDALTQIGL